jgi:transposase
MAARHRVSKLLLRQGIVYSGGNAWTLAHDAWLRAQRFDQPALQAAYDSACPRSLTAGVTDHERRAARTRADCGGWGG